MLNGKYLGRFEGSKYTHLRSRSIYKRVPCAKIWLPCLSFQPTHSSCSAWPPIGKHKDSSKDLKCVYIYEFLSYLTLTKRFVLVLKQQYYRNLKITKPGIGCVLPNFSFPSYVRRLPLPVHLSISLVLALVFHLSVIFFLMLQPDWLFLPSLRTNQNFPRILLGLLYNWRWDR